MAVQPLVFSVMTPVVIAFSCLVIGCAGSEGATASVASTADSSGESEGGDTTTSDGMTGDTEGTTDSATGSATDSAMTDTDGTSSTGGCELDEVELDMDLGVLEDHIADLQEVSAAISSDASDLKPVGFLAAPGYSDELLIAVAPPLDQACEAASVLDPVCEEDEGRCWQVACTGEGALWSLTSWVNLVPAQAGDYTFSELEVTVSSVEAAGSFDFQISSLATKGPATWGVTANGSIVDGDFQVVVLLPELIEGHETVLVANVAKGVFGGQLEVDNVAVAMVGADGTIEPIGECWSGR